LERERSLYGSEFEVRLRNELTQKAIAKECAEWMRKKVTFRSNKGRAPMQQFACATGAESEGLRAAPRIHRRGSRLARRLGDTIDAESLGGCLEGGDHEQRPSRLVPKEWTAKSNCRVRRPDAMSGEGK
jgi:hypothetical protein